MDHQGGAGARVPLVLEGLAHGRVGHLGLAGGLVAQGDLAPHGGVVKQVPVLEGQLEAAAAGSALTVDAQAALGAALQPADALAVLLRVYGIGGDCLVEHRAAGNRGYLLEEVSGLFAKGAAILAGLLVGQLDEAFVAVAEDLGEGEHLMLREQVGDHRGAVVVALHRGLAKDLRRPAAGAVIHGMASWISRTISLQLSLGGAAGLRLVPAHDPSVQRGQRHVGQAVDALGGVLQAVDEVGEGDPVPGHSLFHGVVGDGLVSGHAQHGAVPVFDAGRRKAEAAVAQSHRRDAVPAGQGAVGVPENLGVVVGVQVDEAGGHDQALGVDFPLSVAAVQPADLGDATVLDGDIADVAGRPGPVDDGTASDDDVVGCHWPFSSGWMNRMNQQGKGCCKPESATMGDCSVLHNRAVKLHGCSIGFGHKLRNTATRIAIRQRYPTKKKMPSSGMDGIQVRGKGAGDVENLGTRWPPGSSGVPPRSARVMLLSRSRIASSTDFQTSCWAQVSDRTQSWGFTKQSKWGTVGVELGHNHAEVDLLRGA